MWKSIVRGIQSTIERRACRTNVYSQSSQDNTKNQEIKTNLINQPNLLPSTFISFNKSFCGQSKSTGAKDEKNNSEWNARHTWTEAVSWVNIFLHVLCNYASQQ